VTPDEIRSIVVAELSRIAPESDPARLADFADLRDELDIDSMDFLNFVTALNARTGVAIPETDYAKLFTLGGAVAYLAGKAAR
jgi:acyl carrier protein